MRHSAEAVRKRLNFNLSEAGLQFQDIQQDQICWGYGGQGAGGFRGALVVKNLPANAADIRDAVSVPGLGRSPGIGHGNPLQYSCLENTMDGGDWRAMIHGITESWP